MSSIDNLPLPIYEIIRDYIIDYKKRTSSIRKEVSNWKSFLFLQNTLRFREIRSVSDYFTLSSSLAFPYLLSKSGIENSTDSLLEYIMKAITTPSKQLQLDISRDYRLFGSLRSTLCQRDRSLIQCHSLICYEYHFESFLHISDVFDISSIEYLNFRGCSSIDLTETFSSSSSSSSRRIKYLALSDTEKDVQDSNVHVLNDIPILNLSDCHYLSDVSSLINVFDLNLQGNSLIKDVSCFKNSKIYRLNVSQCNGIEDISALSDIPVLNVAWSDSIKIGLRNDNTVKELTISSKLAVFLKLFENKEKKRVVCIEGDIRMKELESCFCGFRKIFSRYNDQIPRYNQDVPGLHHLSLRFCALLCSISSLRDLRYLKLASNSHDIANEGLVIDFLSLPSLVTLEAEDCRFKSLDLNGSIQNVFLSRYCLISNNKITVFNQLQKLVIHDYRLYPMKGDNKQQEMLFIDKVGSIDKLVCNSDYALFHVKLL
jgi:hypothetical protein